MTKDSRFLIELHSIIDDNTSCVVKFSNASETMAALDELDSIKSIHRLRKTILRIRKICRTVDGLVHYPRDEIELPKARWLSVAATASFSVGIPIDTIIEKSALDRKTVAAYCTSVNNPTSEFLTVIEDRVHINSKGIPWLLNLLVKDKQIDDENTEK